MHTTSSIAFGSPSRYIQGPGELYRLPRHSRILGEKVFAVIDEFFFEQLTRELSEIYQKNGIAFTGVPYKGEITKSGIDEKTSMAQEAAASVIIGIGGGKTLDTAKAVASRLRLPLIIVPTSASTDAPTSAMSIIYNDAHEHSDVYYYTKNPDLVLVDSKIIADAPVRFLVSGMGDAIATVFEARATRRTGSPNYINQDSGPYRGTRTASAIAELCYQTILENGRMAKIANEKHVVTEALEAVIEANILMSGLGFENVGCSAAHAVHNGLSACPDGNKALHGEKVAFGVLCQLAAENAPRKTIRRLMKFYLDIGLPLTLEDMGISPGPEKYEIIAADVMQTEWVREPLYVNEEVVKASVITAQEMGKMYKLKYGSM
ncbi:MAG TPA: glycerol dehydrogenase [Lachnospiraceae bacterium]|nr:glycerol dehydrogenase [Lachnospiraceae bacterium]